MSAAAAARMPSESARAAIYALPDVTVTPLLPCDRRLPDPVAEPTITVDRAAAVLGIGKRAAYYAAERGELPSIRVGRLIRIPTARFLAKYFPPAGGDPSNR
jgi:excisionase family DNA binding protein